MSFLVFPGFGRARSVDTSNGRAAGPSLIDDDFSEYMGVHTDTDSDDELGSAELTSRQTVQQQEMQLRRLQRVLAPPHPRLPNNVRGLRGAMLCVKECKDKLRSNPPDALIQFIHACWHSPFAPCFLKRTIDKLLKCIEIVESLGTNHMEKAQCRVLATVARSALVSHQEIPANYDSNGVLEQLAGDGDWRLIEMFSHELLHLPLAWVHWVWRQARFRTLWDTLAQVEFEPVTERIAERQRRRQHTQPLMPHALRNGQHLARAQMQQDCRAMGQCRPHHAASLQAERLCHKLVLDQAQGQDAWLRGGALTGHLGDPHRTVAEQQACDAMMECQTTLQCLEAGYETAVEDFPDPATAMQHLLWCIFMILLDMKGTPNEPVRAQLQLAADRVILEHRKLMQMPFKDSTAWDAVAERLVPAMLLVSRLFDLGKIFPNHRMPALLKEEVLRVHKEILQQAAAKDDASDDDSSSSDEFVEHKCTNCRKRRKEIEMHICPKCRHAIYCSETCIRQDANRHKRDCLMHHLKQKNKHHK